MCHRVVIAGYALWPMPTVLRAVLIASLCAGAVAQRFDGDAFVRAHCVECHGGDATKAGLDLTRAETDPVAAAWRWSRLRDRVLAGEMPPPDAEPLPAGAARAFADHVAALLRRAVPRLPVDPGRVTVRRLSRVQWQRVVRDLFGVHVDPSGFPADDLGYGFDTIGDALTFSTLHLEKHLAAARAVAAAVFDGEDPDRQTVRRFEAEAMQLVDGRGADQERE